MIATSNIRLCLTPSLESIVKKKIDIPRRLIICHTIGNSLMKNILPTRYRNHPPAGPEKKGRSPK
jgi:hypothetical protein